VFSFTSWLLTYVYSRFQFDETQEMDQNTRIKPFEALWTSIQPNKTRYLFILDYQRTIKRIQGLK
jgi:hypothetical protein